MTNLFASFRLLGALSFIIAASSSQSFADSVVSDGSIIRQGVPACSVVSDRYITRLDKHPASRAFTCTKADLFPEYISTFERQSPVGTTLQEFPGFRTCPEKWAMTGYDGFTDRLLCIYVGSIRMFEIQASATATSVGCPSGSFALGYKKFRNSISAILCGSKQEKCFGAAGAECTIGAFSVPIPIDDTRVMASINPGSIAHDECCFEFPNGEGCESGPMDTFEEWFGEFGHDGHCTESWAQAGWETFVLGRSWKKIISKTKVNTTGKVVRADTCAPNGTIVDPADFGFCCNTSEVEWYNIFNAVHVAAALTQGYRFGLSVPMVCR